jgi:hypothetical protein
MMPIPRQAHRFVDSKQKAADYAQLPWIESLYRRAFHNYESSYVIRSDGWAQRGGMDRKINLTSGRSVFIEEKFRDADYWDFFLETWSDKQRKKPGWMQQDLLADFVAYVFIPSRKMYLLPYLDLRRAWLTHGRLWLKKCPRQRVPNPGYVTEGIVVPIRTVLSALRDGMFFEFTGEPVASDTRGPVQLPLFVS